MSERQVWRPPVAPKPTNAALIASGIAARDASPATGQSVIVHSPPQRANTTNLSSSAGAAVAAAAAGRARAQARHEESLRHASPSPVRGRSQLSADLQRAVRSLEIEGRKDPPRPQQLNRTASEAAARNASTNASPSRPPVGLRHKVSAHGNGGMRDDSTVSRSRDGSESSTALLGAAMSMSPDAVSDLHDMPSTSPGKIDFTKIPSFNRSPGTSPKVVSAASNTSTTAARTASQEAQRRRAQSLLDESPPPRVPRLPERLPLPAKTVSSTNATRQGRVYHSPTTIEHIEPRKPSPKQKSPTTDSFTALTSPNASLPIPIPPRVRTSPRIGPSSPSPKNSVTAMDVNNLANAMVGASLASTRTFSRPQSPIRKHAPPVPRRRSRSLHEADGRRKMENPPLKPMTMRPMKQTLRKEQEEKEDEKRGRKHLIRKHPNVHHEGDRKRWRDKVTAQERKRYEGLWAANRGVLHEYESFDPRSHSLGQDELVLNIVVRDVWERSRLPHDVLEEVWDLVVEGDERALGREQFVVGLWLIDQRLKGRKLPVKISQSVWASVRHTQGVKVRNKPI